MRLLPVVLLVGCDVAAPDAPEAELALRHGEPHGVAPRVAELEEDLAEAIARIEELEEIVAGLPGGGGSNDFIRIPEQWTVGAGGDYATLADAWAAAQEKRLLPTAHLTILLLDGTHALATHGIVVNHPDGSRISIVGSSSGAVTVTSDIMGFILDEGHALDEIGGFTLQGTDQPGTGLWLRSLARVALVTDLVIRDYGAGAIVEEGSALRTNFVGLTTDSNIVGLVAGHGALVEGTLDARDNDVGVNVFDGSVVRTNGADFSGNASIGADVRTWGLLNAPNSDFRDAQTGVRLAQSAVFAGGGSHFGGGGTGISVTEMSFAEIVVSDFDGLIAGVVAKHNSTVMANNVVVANTTVPLQTETDSVVMDFPP